MYNVNNPVNPAMLVLARELRCLSLREVGQQSGIPLLTLYAYETEGGVLPERDFHALADGYGFPGGFFFREGDLHPPQFPVCYVRDPFADLHAQLQDMLDEIVGDEVIADVDLMDDGYFVCQYESDENRTPIFRRKLGNTELQAERSLKRALRLYRKTGVHLPVKAIEGMKPRAKLKLVAKVSVREYAARLGIVLVKAKPAT